jgi:hypothetical protein
VVWLHLAAGTRLTAATVDGLTVPATVTGPSPGGEWGWGFGFYALPADGVEVDLTVAGSTPLRVRVVDQSDGLTGIAGYVPPPPTVTWSALPSNEVYVGRTVNL